MAADARRVRVATGTLQEHARYLRNCEDFLRRQVRKLEDGAIPATLWGVPNYGYAPGDRRGRGEPQGHPSPALQAAKIAYEAAHAECVNRMYELCSLWIGTAEGLETVARNYALADMRDPGSPYEQEAR